MYSGALKIYRAVILTAAILTAVFSVRVMAASEDWDDPDYVKRYYQSKTQYNVMSGAAYQDGYFQTSEDPYTGLVYSHSEMFNGCDILHGVDVSRHNGVVNWEKVKAAGIDFVILRIGYSRLNTDIKISKTNPGPLRLTKDENYDMNLSGVRNAGLPLGIYYFSQAVTTKEAKKEAAYVLELLDGMKLDLPVVFDSEMTPGGRLAKVNPGKTEYNKIAKAFCEKIKAAGYTPMVYSSYYGMKENYNAAELETLYAIWLARYNINTFYDGKYMIWQYSSSGKVDGIPGSVDMNFYYRSKSKGPLTELADETKRVKSLHVKQESSASLSMNFSAVEGATAYDVERSECIDGPFTVITTVTGTSYTDKKLESGKEYYYRIRSKYPSGNKTKTGPASPVGAACTKRTQTTKIRMNQAANLRASAGVNHASYGIVPEGRTLTVIAKTKNVDNLTWYKVKTEVGGETVTGYVSARCSDIKLGKVKTVKIKSRKSRSITLSWSAVAGADGYEIRCSDSPNGTYEKVGETTGGKTVFKHAVLERYTEYYYRIYPLCHVDENTNYGKRSSTAVLGTSGVKSKFVSTGALTVRQYAGTKYRKVCTIPAKTKMVVYYRTKDKAGSTWYHVKLKYMGKAYEGYVNAAFVRKK